jgi:hypothetical protein
MAAYDLEIEQIDVKTAFLYSEIDADIYIEQPEGFCMLVSQGVISRNYDDSQYDG